MSFSSPSPSRPASSFGEMQNATSNNNTNNNKSTRLRKSIRANDNIAGNNIMASSPLLGMFSADGKAPSLRNRNGTLYINNSIASEERKNSSYGANKVSSEALFQYYAVKGNFEIMHADEFSDGVIDSCLASATPPLPPLLSSTETKSEQRAQGVEEGNVSASNNNNNKSDEHVSSTSAAAEVEKANANSISVMIDNDLNKADGDLCHLYNPLRPAQANDVIVKVATRKQIEEQQKNAAAQLRLSMMTLPPLCSYYYNLYKGDAANASLVNEIQTGLVHEAERVEKEVAKHKREVASHSSNASTTRSKEMNKTRLTNTNTQSSINPLPNWNQSPKTLSPTSTLNYTYSNNNMNNNNNNNTFNNSASSSSMMLMGATNTNTNTNNIIPAPPPLPTSASSARSVSAQGTHHLPSQTHQRNSITLNADNLPFSPSTENIFSNHSEKEFNSLLELHAKRMELLNKLEGAFAKMKAEVSGSSNNTEFNKTNTFARLSMTAASTNQVTTHETNKKDGKGSKKISKKRKTGKHEEKPSTIPINLTYFINALLPFTDRAGRVSLRVVECAFHSAPFEVNSNAQNEAVRTLFYWIINHSQAMHDHAATGYDASRGGTAGEEETDSSGFASGVNINVHNSISLRNNTMMNNTIATTTNSSNSNEERNKSMSRMNKPNSHVNSPSNSISINRPSGMSRDVSRAMTGSMENKNMLVSAAAGNAGLMTYNSISGTLRQQSNNIFSKSVKQHALEQYIYLHELIAALDGLINSKETGKIARFQCFQALVLNSNGNHYIHRAWLDKIRIEQKQVSHINHKSTSTASTHKNKTDNMESTSSVSMKMKVGDGCNSKSAWTPSLVAALNCAFDAIAQTEEAEYIKLMSKRGKRRGKNKDSNSSNTKTLEAAQKSSANAKSGSSSPSSATLSSGAMGGTASNNINSVIPLNVMRRCHFNFDEFDKWFDTLPMLAASLLPIWLPLLIGTLHLSNVMNSEADHGSHGHNNMDNDNDNDTDDDDHVVNGEDSKDVSVMESSSARLHRNKTKAESSLSLSLSRKNDVNTAEAPAAGTGTITDINNAENSFAHSQGDDMSKSKADTNTNITKIKNTMVPSSGQSGTLQSAHEKRSDAQGAIAEVEMGTYPLTMLGEDEMARHAFLQELIKERVAHMNDYVV